ncbi:hypothetical protein ACFL2O_04995 [Thermodesulfobacteriota bacterium]
MIENKKKFFGGLVSMIGFIIVLVIFFSPLFAGKNGLDYLDNLFNSISKGSAYYIQKVKSEAYGYKGVDIRVAIPTESEEQGKKSALLYKSGGAGAAAGNGVLKITGDLGNILSNCLEDADYMYSNEGEKLSSKYGYNEREVLYNWWKTLNAMGKALKKQKKFKEADIVSLVVKKAVEPSYNYYRIEPQDIGDRWGIVIFALIFYVVYTLWYGYSIMYMFEGWGMKLGH